MKNRISKNSKSDQNTHKPHNQKRAENAAKFTEFTVKVRIKRERAEWFSDMSDCLGLTRDQAVSGMLESTMGADHDLGVTEAQSFVVRAAAELFPERRALRSLERAYNQVEFTERRLETAKGAALSGLFDLAPDEMGVIALERTRMALLCATSKSRKARAS